MAELRDLLDSTIKYRLGNPDGRISNYFPEFNDWTKRTAAEIAAGVTPANYAYPPGDARRYGYNPDGLDDDSDTGTDNTTAIQNCLDANEDCYFPRPTTEGRVALFTSVTVPARRTIYGDGPRTTVFRQISHTSTDAFTLEDLDSDDISEGAFIFRDFGLKIAYAADELSGANGFNIGEINASMLEFTNVRIWSQIQETLSSAPYDTIPGQRAIYAHSNSVGAVFVAMFNNLEVRSCDIAIDASGIVNEWAIYNSWAIDCRVAARLNNCSTWRFDGYSVETGVSAARAYQFLGPVSNVRITGGRWELTRPTSESGGCYGIEGDGSWTGGNIRVRDVNVIINGDGSAIPGRKWTGTIVNDLLFEGYDADPKPFFVVPNLIAMRMPNDLVLGGNSLGDGRIRLYRNSDGTLGGTIETGSSAQLDLTAGNAMNFFTGGSQTAARLDDTTTAGNTRLLVFDVDNNTLERVTVGAADSGGVGFKVLRIPN